MQISNYTGLYPPPTVQQRESATRAGTVDALQSSQSKKDAIAQNPNQATVAGVPLPVATNQQAGKITTLDAAQADMTRGRVSTIDTNQPLPTQRALAEYLDIDSREQRSEYTAVLGIDVYA